MSAVIAKRFLPSKAYGMTESQLAAWHADVVTKRIPKPYRFDAVTFQTDAHGTVLDGYVKADTDEGIAFVRGWLVGRDSIA